MGGGARRDRGQTLVEFALAFPVVLVILLGILEIGWMAFNQTANLNAARAGSRAGSLGQDGQSIEAIAMSNSYGLPITGVEVSVTDPSGSQLQSTDRTSGNIITVTTRIDYQAIGPVFSFVPAARINALYARHSDQID